MPSSRSPEVLSLDWLRDVPFAHRGLHEAAAGVPENSLAAFEAAVAAGYGIELDIRLAADGVPVVFHDETLRRLAGVSGDVAAMASTELSRARLLDTGEHIPSLAEALALIGGRVPVLIEVKNLSRRAGALEGAVLDLLRDYRGAFAMVSFNSLTLAWFRRRAPGIPRGQNVARRPRGRRGAWTATSSRLSRLLGQPHFISHQFAGLTHRASVRIRGHGLPLIVWTLKHERELGKAALYADNFMFEGFRPRAPSSLPMAQARRRSRQAKTEC